ncbi:uncharacterized protein K02A2.6-like [Saccostrea echinata]|uniref:uncharacterized protein K02A2.6-like n=1 Tax=Saccostrea echinata TaxID=191078 RepID=UPI002A8035BC|nr:uncharacterized protein K02A2.6-like [Saccostrea echinata]
MATGRIGRVDVFDPAIETWTTYEERLDNFFTANAVDDNKKVPALLSLVGPKTYALLRDLTAPELPKARTYKQLTKALKDHYSPKPLVIVERFRFHKRDQQEGESVREYIAALRKLSEFCEFKDVLNDTLRDRFVCGLKNEHIQKKLLSEKNLTYQTALEIAIAMETATNDALEIQRKHLSITSGVNKLSVPKGKKRIQQKQTTVAQRCYRCNGNHTSDDCKFIHETCRQCGKKGHIQRACRSKPATMKPLHTYSKHVHEVEVSDDFEPMFSLCYAMGGLKDAIWIKPHVNGQEFPMELDTGSAISVINRKTYQQNFSNVKLIDTDINLRTYSGENITPLGVCSVNVEMDDQQQQLNLYVVDKGGPPLFGREWLKNLRLNWAEIKTLETRKQGVSEVIEKYKNVFTDDLGRLRDISARIKVEESATPKFCKARVVPYSLRSKVDQELDHLIKTGILSKVEHSEWATPIVSIPKKDGTVRICGDFKVTVNPVLDIDQYPLPKIEDIFASLAGGRQFTKLDLKNAYLQMMVREEDRHYLTINTHRGLFQYNRLVFGIASAPAIWQRAMDTVLQGLEGVHCNMDDMIITGRTPEEHLKNLEQVLKRLDRYGLKANVDKSEFLKDKIEFCGHVIDAEGLHKTSKKIEAVLNAPEPKNVSELRAFLGLVNYYGRFMENLSTHSAPLYDLLKDNSKFVWSKSCRAAFEKIKELVTSDQVLVHYDPQKPVTLATDASPYGLGAVLSHVMPDGSEKPIAFASRSLSQTERKYAQIDKEALGLVWGVKKFHAYLYGRKFTLVTDHQPLVSIFHPEKGLPVTTAARLQRYAIFLSGFQYDIRYKNTKKHSNADALSRLPVPTEGEGSNEEAYDVTELYMIQQLESLPVSSKEVQRGTVKDTTLKVVYDMTASGWPASANDLSEELKAYFSRRNEISIYQGCLLWGIRVIIPQDLRSRVLEELHEGHPGIV